MGVFLRGAPGPRAAGAALGSALEAAQARPGWAEAPPAGPGGLTSQLSPWGFSQPLPGGSQAGLTSQPTLRGWGFVMVWAGCSLSAGAGGRGLAVCRVGTQVQPPEGVWLGLLLVAGGGGWVGGGLTVRSRGLFAVHPEGWFY